MKKTPRKRRRQGKTDYANRVGLLKSEKPRVVCIKTNKYFLVQYVLSEEAKDKIENIRERIVSGNLTFSDAAKEASEEKETKFDGGLLINPETQDYSFELTKMDPELYSQISNLKEEEVSIVYQDEDRVNPIKFKILSVSNRYDEHVADYSKDYLKIQKLALQSKQLKEIEKWQDSKITETFVKVSMEHRDCNFYSNWLKK